MKVYFKYTNICNRLPDYFSRAYFNVSIELYLWQWIVETFRNVLDEQSTVLIKFK